jgi:phospholipid/cholesterol/gamma-HCH transport system substrate-binding protein
LVKGNNVRYAGIQVGTVKKITLLNDTTIEVLMYIDEDMKAYIHKDDIASLGTDGLVGNRLINITPSKTGGALAVDGDLLRTHESKSTEAMLEELSKTNGNLVLISEELRKTISNINNSKALWAILNDESLPLDVRRSLQNIRNATVQADHMAADLALVISDVKAGKGSAGILLRDSAFAISMQQAVSGVHSLEQKADGLISELNSLVQTIHNDLKTNQGPAGAALTDSVMVQRIHQTLINLEAGTASFNQNMEALKHNFLFKGYFKKLEKEKQRELEEQ